MSKKKLAAAFSILVAVAVAVMIAVGYFVSYFYDNQPKQTILSVNTSVESNVISMQSLSFSKTHLILSAGESVSLPLTVSDIPTEELVWEVDHPEISSVSQDGVLTGLSSGTCTVTVFWQDHPNFQSQMSINVYTKNPYQTEDLPFLIDGTVSTEAVEATKMAYQMVPANLRERFEQEGWTMILSGNDIDKLYGDNKEMSSTGITSYDNQIIYIKAEKVDAIPITVLHEIGHFLDHITDSSSRDNEFKQIWQIEKDTVAHLSLQSAKNHPWEYFAELFALSIQYPSDTQSSAPSSYLYITEKSASI